MCILFQAVVAGTLATLAMVGFGLSSAESGVIDAFFVLAIEMIDWWADLG